MHPELQYQMVLEHHRDLRENSKSLPQQDKRGTVIIMRMSVIITSLLMVLWLA
jgi:hypothetical protein